jgi:hypothetical protein
VSRGCTAAIPVREVDIKSDHDGHTTWQQAVTKVCWAHVMLESGWLSTHSRGVSNAFYNSIFACMKVCHWCGVKYECGKRPSTCNAAACLPQMNLVFPVLWMEA